MRTSVFILLAVLLATNLLIAEPLKGQGAEQKTVTVDFNNTPISTILQNIQAKTGVSIMFENTKKIFSEKVSVFAENIKLGDLLDKLLSGKSIKWSVRDNIILLENASGTITIPGGAPKFPAIV